MKSQSGSILIVVLLVLFLLTSLGISYVALTQGDKGTVPNPMAGAEALGSAQAGISEALARMSVPGSALYVGENAMLYRPGWGRYLVAGAGDSALDPEYEATASDGLDNDGDGEIDEASEHYPEIASQPIGAATLGRHDTPWVKVRYKLDSERRIVLFGDHDDDPSTPPIENPSRGVPKLIITAAGRSGAGWKMVTVEAVKWPLPPAPAALYVEGDLGFRDAAFHIDGRDHEERAPHDTIAGAPALPGVATPTDARPIAAPLTEQQGEGLRGVGSEPSVLVSSTNLDLKAMAAAWSRIADITLDGDQVDPKVPSWGSSNDPKIVHVKGNLRVTGFGSGAGVLVVDGDLDLSGTISWTGLILCLQDARIRGGGNGVSVIGSVLVQGSMAGRSEVSGDVSILYSSSAMRHLAELTGYEVSSWIDQ